ncbi:MAG TPA: carboxypeptidase-like regulatory domain-containing protein [Candidatus Paceibacterota bacterium]|nr:carboxypeptidase-like regulatory domain-containing protein [Candidatus Paceibacterota bacterium]
MQPVRGVSFVDVIVGSALVLIVFLSLFSLLRASLLVSTIAKARAAATSVATSQMEYVRSLSYDSVGTIGGIPPGVVPQYATTTLDGYTFVTRTFIEYVDDAKDGTGAGDQTGITTDYKRVKVSVTYELNDKDREVALVSNVVPPGLETTTGGGTLMVAVVGAAGQSVPGASVRIVNASSTPSIDVTTFSNTDGIVFLPGAATSSEYQIYVSKDGYSSAQTYKRDATNQNPTPGYLTVVKDVTTTGTFAIDLLASLALRTFTPIEAATSTDTFADSSSVADLSNTVVSGGSLTLAGVSGSYPAAGSARSTAITPSYLAAWTSVSAVSSLPTATDARIQVLDGTGTPLPDSVLAGNSAGFTTFPISLATVSTTTYPTLMVRAELTTSDVMVAPSVLEWHVAYTRGPVPLPNVSFSLQGAKTIGSTGAGVPLYKTTVAEATDGSGIAELSLEWDVYSFSVDGYDVVDACSAPPFTLAPGTESDHRLMMGPETTNALLVSVRDAAGTPVAGADVTLSRTGFTETVTTSACGTAYFGGVASASTYTVQAAKAGYVTQTQTNLTVSGKVFYAAQFE